MLIQKEYIKIDLRTTLIFEFNATYRQDVYIF